VQNQLSKEVDVMHSGSSPGTETFAGEVSLPQTVILVSLVGIVSYVAAGVGTRLEMPQLMVAPVWPGNAILVAVLLLVPRRIWAPLIVTGLSAFTLFDLQTGLPVRTSLLLNFADAVEVIIAAVCLSYFFGEVFRLTSIKALAKYSLVVIPAPIAGALVGALITSADYWRTFRVFFLSGALEFLILVPAILGLFQEGPQWRRKSLSEYAEAIALLIALVVSAHFTLDTLHEAYLPVMLYLVPLLLWAALRFGMTGVSISMIVLGFLSIQRAVRGQGPFDGPDPLANLVSLQLFLLFTIIPFMVLACLAQEYKQSEQELKRSEEKFSRAFRESPLAVTLTSTRDHRYIDVNETFERITGYTRDQVLGRTPFDIAIWVEPSERMVAVEKLLKESSFRNVEHRFRTKSGEVHLGISSAQLIEIDGEPCMLAITDDITDRKRAEEHFRLAVESAPNGMMIVDQFGTIVLMNSQSEALFGYRREELVGQSVDVLLPESLRMAHHSLRHDFLTHPEARSMGAGRDLQARRKDGTQFFVEIGLNPLLTNEGIQVLCSIVDVTARKMAERSLRESEERFRLVANSAPVLIWMSGVDKLCIFFNQGWLDFTGRTLEEELGEGWASGVHPEDLNRCLETYSTALNARLKFDREYRLRRHDGQYRWIEDRGVPRFEADGTFRGYIGTAIDMTDRKIAEEALLDMGGRLITAHEQERTRIARELHDDLSQRMALLEIGLRTFELDTPGLSAHSAESLRSITKMADEISSDIHSLSHELHPSKLDALGLMLTVSGFCRDFSKQHGIQVRFVNHGVPVNISKDVSLCFFRIVQEALRNVAKHSRALEATVDLSVAADGIELCVSDSGVGIDAESQRKDAGIGLISMRERLRVVSGHLSIESGPSRGTRIRAHVPMHVPQEWAHEENRSQAARANGQGI
jgi:PAS domain S-box-containing protein